MKYKELSKIAEENGYEFENNVDDIILTKYQGDNIIKISKLKENLIFPNMYACFNADWQMLKAAIECAETLHEDRY